MIFSEIQKALDALRGDPLVYSEAQFEARLECIDRLDFHIIDRIDHELLAGPEDERLVSLRRDAERIREELERINRGLFRKLRAGIRGGAYRGAAFARIIDTYITQKGDDAPRQRERGYDALDVLVNGILASRIVPVESVPREPEMVAYQPAPARVIFALAARAQLTTSDVFYDLGSGLGRVCMLVNLLRGVTARGIELEPVYCAYARACAKSLGLSQVEFIQADARSAAYACGTVFFLYTPFTGRTLQTVLDRLKAEASARQITVFTYGPCTQAVFQQPWLRGDDQAEHNAHTLAEFKSLR